MLVDINTKNRSIHIWSSESKMSNAGFDESKVSRDKDGKFAPKGSGKSSEKQSSSKKSDFSKHFKTKKFASGEERQIADFEHNGARINAIKDDDGTVSGKIYAPAGKKIKGTKDDKFYSFETSAKNFDKYVKSVTDGLFVNAN